MNASGGGVFVGFSVYQSAGSDFSGLSFLGCNGFPQSSNFDLHAGSTYYFQVGSTQTGSFNFQFHVQQIPPPANDDFANATQVSTLPFSDVVDHPIAATLEPGEPLPCQGGDQSGSVWWAFTPSATRSYSASDGFPATTLAVYQGSSLADLNQVGCAGTFSTLTFHATAGVRYFFRAFGPWDPAFDFGMSFQLEATPAPVANFFFQPSDPSVFDTVQFFDGSVDPGEVGFQAEAWDFGDGTTGTGGSAAHRYAADGDYTVRLTVTTFDGRTASVSQVVHVSTHDVAIAKFTVPTSGSTGQTRSITVGISDKRYPETVQVQFLASNSRGGFDLFFDQSSDPGEAGIKTRAWDFGDGTTGTGQSPAHRYAADGTYTTTLTITTSDGRTASTSQVVHVSTHDVAVTKFTVPTSASTGQTRSITVGVSDKRYPETVQVQLLKADSQFGGGFELIGTLTQPVPAQTGKTTTPFTFSYTYTPGDASIGKATFEAIATIAGPRDALPTDNIAVASTTVH